MKLTLMIIRDSTMNHKSIKSNITQIYTIVHIYIQLIRSIIRSKTVFK